MKSSFAPKKSATAFKEFCEAAGRSLRELTLREGVTLMTAFYKSTAAKGCKTEESGDMLLYQWGTYERREGTVLEIDITRQFIESRFVGDDAISQLHLTFNFPISERSAAVGSGNRWCDEQSKLEEFHEFVDSNQAYREFAGEIPAQFSLSHDYV